MTGTQKLILALPKGRILDEVEPLLAGCDIHPDPKFNDEYDRGLRFATNHANLDVIRVRAFDVATFVAYGAAQFGVVGRDVLEEFNYDELYAPLALGIGRCRLSVAMPEEDAARENPRSWSHIRVATKYPRLTRRHFAKRSVQTEIIKLNGAMEIAPNLGLCRRIVDLVSSGKTLKANGLKEVEEILNVESYLVVNRTALKTMPDQMNAWIGRFEKALSRRAA